MKKQIYLLSFALLYSYGKERVLEKMNIKQDFKFHTALDDARATALILQQILNEK